MGNFLKKICLKLNIFEIFKNTVGFAQIFPNQASKMYFNALFSSMLKNGLVAKSFHLWKNYFKKGQMANLVVHGHAFRTTGLESSVLPALPKLDQIWELL